MSILLAAALAVGVPTLPSCSWDRPGVNPYRGDVVAAVDRYTDIPAAVRAKLKQRMAARQYDDMADIRRDSITGKARYGAQIRDMHFGQGTVCRTVTRSRWADTHLERGMVYCESGHCLIVPTVCNNVSRITRLPGKDVAAEATEPADAALPRGVAGAPGAGGGGAPAAAAPDGGTATAQAANAGEIAFDPPGAGTSFAEGAQPATPAVAEVTPGGNGSGSFAGGTTAGAGGGGGGPVMSPGAGPAAGPSGPGWVGGPAQPLAPAPLFGLGSGGVAQPNTAGLPPRFPEPTPSPGPGTPPAPPLPSVVDPFGPIRPGAQLPSITPAVPEPGTWALMAAGVGLLALRARRRKV